MSELKRTVTVTVPVSGTIADLVYFVKRMVARHGDKLKDLTDEQLVAAADDFWDSQHGECD